MESGETEKGVHATYTRNGEPIWEAARGLPRANSAPMIFSMIVERTTSWCGCHAGDHRLSFSGKVPVNSLRLNWDTMMSRHCHTSVTQPPSHMTLLCFKLLALIPVVLAESHFQGHLGVVQKDHEGVNSASMFRKPEWNGLVTFAHTLPLRCLGEGSSEKFDVAILGR